MHSSKQLGQENQNSNSKTEIFGFLVEILKVCGNPENICIFLRKVPGIFFLSKLCSHRLKFKILNVLAVAFGLDPDGKISFSIFCVELLNLLILYLLFHFQTFSVTYFSISCCMLNRVPLTSSRRQRERSCGL